MNIVLNETFLSSVLGKKVINGHGHEVGRLRDLVMELYLPHALRRRRHRPN